jgi:hypothetical protein
MKFKKKIPRTYSVGLKKNIIIKDMGSMELLPNEQITFLTKSKKRYDFCKKNWGFYATPSVNFRLRKEGFKTALVRNSFNRLYVMVVEKKFMLQFKKYCKKEKQKIVIWLDDYIT